MLLKKIISGAQTGADRAALDVAIINGLPHGGWVPKGRKAEDGKVPEKYQVIELSSNDYRQRTEMNVQEVYDTFIIFHCKPDYKGVVVYHGNNRSMVFHQPACEHFNCKTSRRYFFNRGGCGGGHRP